jgi:GTP cyclohydrolase I
MPDLARLEHLVRQILMEIGEDPEREGLLKTPDRVARALEFLTSGYRTDPRVVINDAIFTQEANSMVIVKDIELYSLCEHHMLPFFGRCHIGYIPDGKVFGVSKLARLVDMFARRLQLQERLTNQIARAIDEALMPRGVAVVIEASHGCMSSRGVNKHGISMVTKCWLGDFREDPSLRRELMDSLPAPVQACR